MKSIVSFVCFLLLGTCSLAQEDYKSPSNQLLSIIGKITDKALDTVHQGVKLGTTLTDSGVKYGTGIGKMGVAAGTTLGSQGMEEGTILGEKVLDLVAAISKLIPLAERPTNLVTSIAKEGLKVGNAIGQKGLSATLGASNTGLDYADKIAHVATKTVENLSEGTKDLTKGTVNSILNSLDNLKNILIYDVGKAFVPARSESTIPQQTNQPQSNQLVDVKPVVTEPAPVTSTPKTSTLSRFWG